MTGSWMPHCYATVDDLEVLIIFNVYGAATTLEVLRLLEDGGVKYIGFIGSAFSKADDIGKQLLITTVFDQAGIVLLDGGMEIHRHPDRINRQRDIFQQHAVEFSEIQVASVPAVLHGIDAVHKFVAEDKVDAVEMELSTLVYFAQKKD